MIKQNPPKKITREKSSFKDPSGFIFYNQDEVYRQVNQSYKKQYDHLLSSGLKESLVSSHLLIPHEEIPLKSIQTPNRNAYKIIKPKKIPFVSYPYEWSFSQLKDAALLTLTIQKQALTYGMILKDASAYNIQFVEGKPILIDTLSFEIYEEGKPWVAYNQFCRHFLSVLALGAYYDPQLISLTQQFLDGIPVNLSSKLLPFSSWASFSLLIHLHLHGRFLRNVSYAGRDLQNTHTSLKGIQGILESLENAIRSLHLKRSKTIWSDYYDHTNYSKNALEEKMRIVEKYVKIIKPKIVWDTGANAGLFSEISAKKNIYTLAMDNDSYVVEALYKKVKEQNLTSLLPLRIDLTNPSPSIGWENEERLSLMDRGPADLVYALALIHHLAIGYNIPFDRIASFYAKIARCLIIEFIPKEDSQVQRLLTIRKDIFEHYTQRNFEVSFQKYFIFQSKIHIPGTKRDLYLLKQDPHKS